MQFRFGQIAIVEPDDLDFAQKISSGWDMASLSGLLHRPFAAMTATVAAALSADVPDKLHKRSAPIFQDSAQPSLQIQSSPPVHKTSSLSDRTTSFSYVSVFTPLNISTIKKFSILSKVSPVEGTMPHHQFVATPLLNGSFSPSTYTLACNKGKFGESSFYHKFVSRPSNLLLYPLLHQHYSRHSFSSFASAPVLLTLYKSANLSYGFPNSFSSSQSSNSTSESSPRKHSDLSPHSRYFHIWHLPKQETYGFTNSLECQLDHKKQAVAVVLLGWLGSGQKHLKRYADWYTSRGIHAITFTVPMKDIASFRPGGKAEQQLDLLVTHLAHWMKEDNKDSTEKYLIFHTFSNTGWLTYGIMLEKFSACDHTLMDKIKGCVVDSAPVATPDPQVWAAGFSAALLKKQSVATKGLIKGREGSAELLGFDEAHSSEPKHDVAETALLVMLENFFRLFFKLPYVDRRLSDVFRILSHQQPQCPQLYIYSSADRVIPADSVEAFIAKQKQAGYKVRACNFVLSPHVDHFRKFPELYSAQLSSFLEECLPCPKEQKINV